MRRNTDHVVMRNNEFVCLHCGQRYTPSLPATIPMFTAMTNSFLQQHRNCKPATIEEPLIKRFEPGGPL